MAANSGGGGYIAGTLVGAASSSAPSGAAPAGAGHAAGCCSAAACCEHLHVMSSFGALLLSGVAAGLALEHKGDIRDCLLGLGPGADRLQDLVFSLLINYSFILLVNVSATVILWLSFFHCDSLECSLKHTLTSERALGTMLGIVWLTFFLQLLRIGYAMTLSGLLSSLAYVCNLGPGVVYLAQELAYAMGNATESGMTYSQYDKQLYGEHYAWSFYLDIGRMVHRFDFLQYCKDTDDYRDVGASSVLYGCFLSLISQALMIMSLSGEKARVAVHDLHEEHNLFNMASRLGSQVQHNFEHLPLLNGDMSQALQAPSALAGRMTDRFTGFFESASHRYPSLGRASPTSTAPIPSKPPAAGATGPLQSAGAVADQSLAAGAAATAQGLPPQQIAGAMAAPVAATAPPAAAAAAAAMQREAPSWTRVNDVAGHLAQAAVASAASGPGTPASAMSHISHGPGKVGSGRVAGAGVTLT